MRKNYFYLVLAVICSINVMAQNIPSYVPKDGLVGYWPFNGNANDESGNGNHGTVNGASLTVDRNGVANSAYSFNGIDNFIRCSVKNIPINNTNRTISLWCYLNTIPSPGEGYYFASYGSYQAYSYGGNSIGVSNNSPILTFRYSGYGHPDSYIDYTEKIEIKKWYNLAGKIEDGKVKFYINGSLVSTANSKSWNTIFSDFFIGRLVSEDDFTDGILDDISIYNRALSDQEITALYTGNPITQNIPSYVPKDGLVGYWPFNGNANDESGNGNHGTVNGATLSADRNGVANNAYNFDGINNYIKIDNNLLSENKISSYSINLWLFANDFKSDYSDLISDRSDKDYAHKYRISCSNNSLKQPGTFLNMMGDGYGETHVYDKTYFYTKTWTNYIVTFDTLNKEMKCYKNGVLVDHNNSSGIGTGYPLKNSATYFGLSISPAGVDNGFNGLLDDIAIYNRALSEQEVQQLYAGCTKETATSSNFNTLMYTNNSLVNLSATPTGGLFSGNGVANNSFNPSKAKLGKNQVKYNFKNTTGCADSTDFAMLVVDTVGATCTKYDTVTIKNNVFDTVKVNKTIYDTVSILKIKFKLTTGISANQLSSLSIYPNPTSDVLHIEVPDAKALEGYRYRILDALGKEVYNQLVTQTTTEIPLKTLGAAGIYQFEILDAKNVSIQSNKIVLQ